MLVSFVFSPLNSYTAFRIVTTQTRHCTTAIKLLWETSLLCSWQDSNYLLWFTSCVPPRRRRIYHIKVLLNIIQTRCRRIIISELSHSGADFVRLTEMSAACLSHTTQSKASTCCTLWKQSLLRKQCSKILRIS